MIKNYADFIFYKAEDAKNGTFRLNLKEYLFNDIWRFLRTLRYAEYIHNTKKGKIWFPVKMLCKWRYKSIGKKLGFSIPMNVFGPGLCLPHFGTIVVSHHSRIGSNCKVHVGVNIGAGYETPELAPRLGNDCYIAPGAKLYGGITLGNGVKIGANAVVNKSFDGDNITLVGVPARAIK